MTAYWAPHAWLPDGIADDVLVTVADGVFASVEAGAAPGTATRLPGVVFPGFANAHSHAFHRALRGRTHDGGGTFWTWREAMYAVASRLDPDSYFHLARAAYAEMALAGVTSVGEFHYLHHAPGGVRYADPNAMASALREAAAEAGVRLTLLDTCYLRGGIGQDLSEPQLRFSDGTADAWAERVAALRPGPGFLVGAAIHSVRAVEPADLPVVGAFDGPVHAHVSEQPLENSACLAAYGRTPVELLADAGVLGPRFTAVHATHLTGRDIGLLNGSGVCLCPTTEADLADGIGPARALADAGVALSLGSDQHAVVDPLLEARALEHGERLSTGERGRFSPSELVSALTNHAALGWDSGRIEPGAPADLVAVRMDTVRTAGCLPAQAVLAASASDVDTVVRDGREVVRAGRHVLGDVAALLTTAIGAL
ncbi:formimidoylglutamate deiminase [Actinokineospora fastidiosa]|uniref:Formimidoylglutamate deiminase n=1 Tax=Actinokineospora fastidiosa TaxID=1816 RepID=A0A918GAI2_9PSEU|nr:formimidoylglutamate deiminase [Actinokineospora fastidiosa]GGS26003.1 formimidoylglutamate deiminase [Actinokineospora fastidiosa]